MPPAALLGALGSYNLLPAIVFMPTRRRCDQAASEAAAMRRDTRDERRELRRDFMRDAVEQHPEIRGHRHWDTIIRGGVASHHAGHIPAWKMIIEKLMSAGLLDAIFATATVAAGVDFPARTVVLTVADARTGSGWRQLIGVRAATDDGPRRTPRTRQRRFCGCRPGAASGSAKDCRVAKGATRPARQPVSARPTRRCSISSTLTATLRRCARLPRGVLRTAKQLYRSPNWKNSSMKPNNESS